MRKFENIKSHKSKLTLPQTNIHDVSKDIKMTDEQVDREVIQIKCQTNSKPNRRLCIQWLVMGAFSVGS